MKEATELPSVHSLNVDAYAQANIILDDQYFCFLDRPDSMIPLSGVLEVRIPELHANKSHH